MNRDTILLRGLIFHGRHGCFPAEKELGQKFIVDVDLHTDLSKAGSTDDLVATVDYSQVYGTIQEIVETHRYNLLEALAEKIATTILARFPVEQVRVLVKKPQVAIAGVVDYFGVEIVRTR